jgi:hypothetical protein
MGQVFKTAVSPLGWPSRIFIVLLTLALGDMIPPVQTPTLEPKSIAQRDPNISGSEIGDRDVREDIGAVVLHLEWKFIACCVLDSEVSLGILEVAADVRWADSFRGG